MAEQLVYFTRITRTQLPGFGDKTLISFLCQLYLDDFLSVVVCFDHAYNCFYFDLWRCLFPLVFVVATYSFRMYGRELPPYIVFIRHICFFVNMNSTAPHTLAYGFHLINGFDRTKNEVSVFRVFCKNEKVSTCSVILIEPRMRFLSLMFFCKNEKVSGYLVILIEPRMRFLSLTFFVRMIRFPPAR